MTAFRSGFCLTDFSPKLLEECEAWVWGYTSSKPLILTSWLPSLTMLHCTCQSWLAEDHSDAANFTHVDCTCAYLMLATWCSHLSKWAGQGCMVRRTLATISWHKFVWTECWGGGGSAEIKLNTEHSLHFGWVLQCCSHYGFAALAALYFGSRSFGSL